MGRVLPAGSAAVRAGRCARRVHARY